MSHPTAHWFIGLVLIVLQAGCGHPSYYADAERTFSTDRHFASQGHFAVYYPAEIALDFPGYVVGIEMSDRSNVLRDGDLVVDELAHAGTTISRLTATLRDGKRSQSLSHHEDRIPFISHVVRYSGSPHAPGTCALYSVYQSSPPELMSFCDGNRQPHIGDWSGYRSAFADSWTAIDALRHSLNDDVASGNYTHLIVATMGWRTPQEETIRNFNSIMRTIEMAATKDFRPLFVGITWVGPWAGRWFDPLVESFAYADIAELADSLGLTWLGVLVNEVVLPLSTKLATGYITHSFGGRAASTAVCIGPAIRRDASTARVETTGAIDRLIAFQAAFSLQRFHKEPLAFFYEDIYFPNNCNHARSIVLTTSEHDTATRVIIWADLAGNYRYFKSFCDENADTLVSCTSVDETGSIDGTYDETMKVLYLDATALIRYRAPGSDGGAQSDIGRPATGRLRWNLISHGP